MKSEWSTVKIVVAVMILVFSASLFATNIAPSLINYQARLTDDQGAALTGTYQLTFTIYDAATGGAAVWTETHSAVSVNDGLFSVLLGNGDSRTAIDETVFTAPGRWLAISVNGGPELSPRTQLVAVPYSQRVNTVDQARGGIISGQVEIQENVAKGNGYRVDAPRLIIHGAALRQLTLAPNDDVILQATNDAGNAALEASYTPDGGSIAISDENGQTAAQLSATPDGAALDLWNTNAAKLSQRKWSLTENRLVRFGQSEAETLFVVQDVGGVAQMAFDDPQAKSFGYGSFYIGPPSQALAPPGQVFHSTDASGNTRFSYDQSSDGSVGLSFYGEGLKDGNSLGPKQLELTQQEVRLFGSTEAETLVVMGHTAPDVGQIVIHDQASPTPTSVSIGAGSALTFRDNANNVIANIGASSTELTGNFLVNSVAAKDAGPGTGFFGQQNNNFLSWFGDGTTTDPNAHAEDVFVIGSGNTIEGKSVMTVGTGNFIDDDGGAGSNGNNTVVIGNQIHMLGNNSFAYGELHRVGAQRSAAFGYADSVDGNNNFAFGSSHNIEGSGNVCLAGGDFNKVVNSSNNSGILAGSDNTIDRAEWSSITGGQSNSITWSAPGQAFASKIGGGFGNVIQQASASSISGGRNNGVYADTGSVGGGSFNNVNTGGTYGCIGGGHGGSLAGFAATIPGGLLNTADGDYSLAAGRRAKISGSHGGTFLWADQNDFDFNSAASNEFAARATGGVRFVSGIDGSGNPTSGVQLAAGSGTWSSLSDRNSKENIENIDVDQLLDQLANMKISEWNYKTQNASIRHIGPMAQDFYKAFGLGKDERHITTIDGQGVALAAIQALYKRLETKSDRVDQLESEVSQLKAMVKELLKERQ